MNRRTTYGTKYRSTLARYEKLNEEYNAEICKLIADDLVDMLHDEVANPNQPSEEEKIALVMNVSIMQMLAIDPSACTKITRHIFDGNLLLIIHYDFSLYSTRWADQGVARLSTAGHVAINLKRLMNRQTEE